MIDQRARRTLLDILEEARKREESKRWTGHMLLDYIEREVARRLLFVQRKAVPRG